MTDGRHDHEASSGDVPWRGTALRDLARELPPVARALEDFISRANQTELARVPWDPGPAASEPGASLAELRAAEARAQGLQAQVDELRGKLAAAAPAAAASALAAAASPAKVAAPTKVVAPAIAAPAVAAPAIAAPVATAPLIAPRSLPWAAIVGSFIGGVIVMLAVSRLTRDDRPTTATDAPLRSIDTPRPTVTPIDPPERIATEPPAVPAAEAAAPPAAAPPAAAPPPETVTRPRLPRPARPTAAAVTSPTHAPAAAAAPRQPDALADPFAGPAAPNAPAKPAKPVKGELVNPF